MGDVARVLYPCRMASETMWLTLPDVAERLGVAVTRVRELIRERQLLAVRREEDGVLQMPAAFLIDGESGETAIPTLRGTIIVLADAGMDVDGIMRWLLSENDELGEAPVDALRSGKKASVRRVAQAAY